MSGTRPAGRHGRPAQGIGLLGLLLLVPLIVAGCLVVGPRPTVQPPPVPTDQPTNQPQERSTLPPLPPTNAPPTLAPTFAPTYPPTPFITPNPTSQGGGLVIPELVGTWTQDAGEQPSGNLLRYAYVFREDGAYGYFDMLCFRSNIYGVSCQPDDQPEYGVAAVNRDQLLLSPTTASDLGVRTYQFAITFDEATGYNTLLFFMPTFVDTWYWQPPN